MLRIGIIGSGLIGEKRAKAIQGEAGLISVSDKSVERARALATKLGVIADESWNETISRDCDVIFVSTSNDAILECATAALQSGKHVLIEKPGGRSPAELRALGEVARETKKILRVGFNHRFHGALQRAKTLLSEGAIGELMYFRGRYGHGGRVGYDREWRANPQLAGGGELLDQGVHLIDLCRWLGGDFSLDVGRVHTFFWNMPVEDNGFLLLKGTNTKVYASLHASCTEWKNLFDFEIFGRTGKIQIFGIGGSYGEEELRIYRRPPQGGVPELRVEKFPAVEGDLSWRDEWRALECAIRGERNDLGTLEDALAAMEIVHDAYEQSGREYAKK